MAIPDRREGERAVLDPRDVGEVTPGAIRRRSTHRWATSEGHLTDGVSYEEADLCAYQPNGRFRAEAGTPGVPSGSNG